jgi:iron complex outermembrane receptor protein
VQYQGNKGAFTMELKAGVQNIFDVHYASMLAVNAPSFGGRAPRYYYPGNPRNFYVTLVFALVDNK